MAEKEDMKLLRQIAREAYDEGLSSSPDHMYNPITQEWSTLPPEEDTE